VSGAFTPGPWRVDTPAYAGMDGIVSHDIIAEREEDGANGIAIVPVGAFRERDPRREANACLISAAPDMFEALEDARDTVHAAYCDSDHEPDAKERTDFDCDRFGPIHCEECSNATAALAKARGDQVRS
jgi:hypothetical protein